MSNHVQAAPPAAVRAAVTTGQSRSPVYDLEAADLVKTYPAGRGKERVRALAGLSIRVEAGQVFGLLGPNGAGKSTTVRILSTLSRADSGTATVAGLDVTRHPEAVRRAIGLVSQRAGSDPMATGRENLELAARIQGMSRPDARARSRELLDRFALTEAADRLAKTYSGGMARKLDVAIGLVHRPRVLFLDEPTTGLDPAARSQMWAEIARLATDEQMTVLLTTHYLDEADRLAHRLAIVDRGQVVAAGTPDELKSELKGDTVHVELVDAIDGSVAVQRLSQIPGLRDLTHEGRTVRARAEGVARVIPAALAALEQAGLPVASATVGRPSLDDVYLRHAGRAFEEVAR